MPNKLIMTTTFPMALASINSEDNSSVKSGSYSGHGDKLEDHPKTTNLGPNRSVLNLIDHQGHGTANIVGTGTGGGHHHREMSNCKKRDTEGRSKHVKAGIVSGKEQWDHDMHILTERERRKKMRNMFTSLHALIPQISPKADKSTIVDEAVRYIKTLQLTLQRLEEKKLERLQSSIYSATTLHYEPSLPSPPLTLMSSSLAAGPSTSVTSALVFDSTRDTFLPGQVISSSPTACCTLSKCNNKNPAPAGTSTTSHHDCPAVFFQTWTSSNVVLNVCGDTAQITVCSTRKPGVFTAICFVLDKYKIEVVSAHVSSDGDHSIFMIQAHASGPKDQDTYKQAAGEIMLWVTS